MFIFSDLALTPVSRPHDPPTPAPNQTTTTHTHPLQKNPNKPSKTGWDVVAISDTAPDYQGSCGKCKEIKCKPMSFRDGYGETLDRNSACYDPSASVVVMVTDTCEFSPLLFFSFAVFIL